MKILKMVFYGLAILIMICCGVVIVCALNPSLTDSLSGALNKEEQIAGNGDGEGVDVSGDGEQDITGENDGTGTVGTTPGSVLAGYIAPAEDAVTMPEQVYGKNGFEPVRSNEEQLPDEEAEALRSGLDMGEVGENLTFDTNLYPYYGMLDTQLQMLYRQIYANAIQQRTSFAPVITVNTERLKDVFEAVYNDHPELFWLETEYSCKYTRKGICIQISLKYNETADNLEESKKKFEEQAQLILKSAGQKDSDYDKELYVHDALIKKVEYDKNADMSQSAYSALVNGESVCAGYARAFQYLMQQMDIPCYYSTGYSGEDHAWNIIKLDDGYYNVDVTWDDTKPATYDYFNKTDIDYAKTHVRKSLSVYLPACTGSPDTNILGSNLDGYINPDPQEPLTYPDDFNLTEEEKAQREKEENLKKAGITEEEVMDNMQEYYTDCLNQMVKVGDGQKYFTNVVPESLWDDVEQAYGSEGYKKGYVTEALKKLGKEHFAIQLQVDDLSGGYYRIYHNIVTW